MKLRKLVYVAGAILGIALVFSALCAAFLHEGARAQAALIIIEKIADDNAPAPGQRVTFTITVSIPTGTPYIDIPILITETLPTDMAFVNASAPYTHGAHTLQWARALSTEAGSEVVTFSVQVSPSATAYFPIVNREYAVAAQGVVVKGEPVTLTVAARPGVALQPEQPAFATFFGSQVQIPYWITNTGNVPDTFTMTAALHADAALTGWSVAPPPPVTLEARAGRRITVTVTAGKPAPRTAPITARVTLTATSPLTSTHNVDVIVTARYAWIYLPLVLRNYPPTPTITAFAITPWRGNAAQQFAYSAAVTLTLAAAAPHDVIQQACFGLTPQSITDCRPYAGALAYTLPAGSGYHTLYAQVKGAQGGVSAPAMAAIMLLANGDFADGLARWDVAQTPLPVAATEGRALLGNAALTCNPIPLGEAAVSQAVDLQAVPAGKTITLYLDYEIVTEDKFTGSDYDRFMALINDQEKHRDGYQGEETFGCGKWHTIQQTDFSIDLTAYQGQRVSLRLSNQTRFDDWYNTYTYVDNVRVVVTP